MNNKNQQEKLSIDRKQLTREDEGKILKYLISSKDIFTKSRKFLREDDFSDIIFKWAFRFTDGFLKKKRRMPSSIEIQEEVFKIIEKQFEELEDDRVDATERTMEFICASIKSEDKTWLEEATKEFIKFHYLSNKMGKDGQSLGAESVGAIKEIESIWSDDKAETKIIRSKEMEKIHWFWPGRIPSGKFNLIVGHPGVGKSVITMMIAAHVSMGKPWPDDPESKNKKGRVLILSAEDALKDTITPRLVAHGYDDKEGAIEVFTGVDEEGQLFNFHRDIGKLDALLNKKSDTRLFIVDPISAYMGKVDTHKDSDVRSVLAPLKDIAEQRNVTVIGVMHLNKRAELENIVQRVMGSTGFTATARSVWLVDRDPESEERYLIPVKHNLGKEQGTFIFELIDTVVDKERAITAPRVEYLRSDKTITATTILDRQREVRKEKRHTEKNKAKRFLEEKLKEYGSKPMPAADLIKEAKEWWEISEHSLNRARNEMGIMSKREGGSDGKWVWFIPRKEKN